MKSNPRFNIVFVVFLLLSVYTLLTFSFIPLFLFEKGLSLFALIFMYAFITLIPVTIIPLLNKYPVKFMVIFGLFTYMLMAVVLFFFGRSYSIIFLVILNGLSIVFYWVGMNYLFFKKSTGHNNAVDSSWYMFSGSLLAVLLPPLAAKIIGYGGYPNLFLISIPIIVVPIILCWRYLGKEVVKAEPFKTSIHKFKGLRTITCLEGALGFFGGVIIPVYALFFINTASSYGWFLSYLALVGLVVGVFLSYYSDKTRKRLGYIYGLFLLMALSIFILIFASNLQWWYLLVGLFSIMATISAPLRLAITLDAKKVTLGFWKIREFYLNLGRFVTLSLSGILFYLKLYWLVFVMYGLMILVYPFLVKMKLNKLR